MIEKLYQLFVLLVICVATFGAGAGEMFLRMAADSSKSYWGALIHPIMLYRVLIFVLESMLLLWAHKTGLPFIAVGILQTVFYVATICGISWHVFHERFEPREIIGYLCCLAGVILLATSKKGAMSPEALADRLFR